MSYEQSEALVLRSIEFSETSRIVTFFTPARGRLVCMAKGANRPKSPYRGLLDTYNHLDMTYSWRDGRAIQQLGDVSLLDPFAGIKRDLEKSTYVALPLEVVYKVVRDNEPSETFFATFVSGLKRLSEGSGDPCVDCCVFMLEILGDAGFEPTLDRCCECGTPVSEPKRFALAGGVACRNCPADVTLSSEASIALTTLRDAAQPEERTRGMVEIFRLLRRFAEHQLETRLRSGRIIDEILTPSNHTTDLVTKQTNGHTH